MYARSLVVSRRMLNFTRQSKVYTKVTYLGNRQYKYIWYNARSSLEPAARKTGISPVWLDPSMRTLER
jgi:hypothetical protein